MNNHIIKFYKYGTVGFSGAQGSKGEDGLRGSQFFVEQRNPLNTDGLFPDVWLNVLSGNLYSKLIDGSWLAKGNILTGVIPPVSNALKDSSGFSIFDSSGAEVLDTVPNTTVPLLNTIYDSNLQTITDSNGNYLLSA